MHVYNIVNFVQPFYGASHHAQGMQKVKLAENTELTLVIFHDEFCVSTKGWYQMKKSDYVTFNIKVGKIMYEKVRISIWWTINVQHLIM